MNKNHFIDPDEDYSRFAEPDEILGGYTEVSFEGIEKIDKNRAAGIAVDVKCDSEGNVIGATVDGEDTNTIIVSATGSGKTRRLLPPYILSCIYAGQSMIIHDPKGENYQNYYKLLKKVGFAIRVINLRDPMKGDRINFLQEAARLWKMGKKGRATEIVDGIGTVILSTVSSEKDKYWVTSALNLFLSYFCIAAELYKPEELTIDAIYKIHLEGLENVGLRESPAMLTYLKEHKGEKCYEKGYTAASAPRDTKGSIHSVFSDGFQKLLLNDEVIDMLTNSTFKIEDFEDEEKPLALFIITRDEKPETYSIVVSSIIDMIYTRLIDMAQNDYKNNRLPRTVHFVMEEFGNLAPLENINSMLTSSRSRNIRMLLVVQSLSQLHLSYSEKMANVVIGNSQNLVYMSSTDMNLVKIISERCGNRIDTYSDRLYPLLSPEKLCHFDKKTGETLLLMDRHYPYVTHFPDLSQYQMIKPLEKMNLKERKKQDLKHGRFTAEVKKILEAQRSERAQNRNGNPKTFDEFMNQKNNSQASESNKTNVSSVNKAMFDGIISEYSEE